MRRTKFNSAKKTKEAALQEYKAVEKLLFRLSHSFNRTTGIEFNELLSEATVLYYESKRTYRKDKGTKFLTWSYRIIYNGLCEFCKRERLERVYDEPQELAKEDSHYFEINEQLSHNAKKIMQFLLEGQVDVQLPPKLVRGELNRHLREQGWKYKDIWGTVGELKQAAKTL